MVCCRRRAWATEHPWRVELRSLQIGGKTKKAWEAQRGDSEMKVEWRNEGFGIA